jgi:hypothetical protein
MQGKAVFQRRKRADDLGCSVKPVRMPGGYATQGQKVMTLSQG